MASGPQATVGKFDLKPILEAERNWASGTLRAYRASSSGLDREALTSASRLEASGAGVWS